MTAPVQFEFQGTDGTARRGVRWDPDGEPAMLIALVHGYGEHIGRYDYVADVLTFAGAVVFGNDHKGHGESEGDRALVQDVDELVADLAGLCGFARHTYDQLPFAMIGHSMGGLVATRFAQLHGEQLQALVLSGPVVGGNPDILALLEMDPIPDVPIDPAVLSRDPEVGEFYAADPLVYHGPFKRETLLAFKSGVERVADGPGFGELPVQWLHGADDQLVPYDVTRDAMEHLRGEVFEERAYEGARHEIFNETNKDEVLGDVTDFLARQAM